MIVGRSIVWLIGGWIIRIIVVGCTIGGIILPSL